MSTIVEEKQGTKDVSSTSQTPSEHTQPRPQPTRRQSLAASGRYSAHPLERFFFRDAERRKWEDVLIGLSFHPVLKNFSDRMGEWRLDRIDYYSMFQSEWSKVFKRTSVLGIPGTKARIMMLVIWSLISQYPDDQKSQVRSFVTEQIIRAMANGEKVLTDGEISLKLSGLYKSVVEDLLKEFQGIFPPDVARDLNEDLPSDFESRMQNDYEYKETGLDTVDRAKIHSLKPLLLPPPGQQKHLLKPANKESERILWWLIKKFHLGCLAESKGDAAKGFYFAVRMPGSSAGGSEVTGRDIPTDAGPGCSAQSN